MNPKKHYIDKRAIVNEEFHFECKNCGNTMTTTPLASGPAQAKCKHCGHIMLYQVDPPKKKGPAPISLKVIPSTKRPGAFQITEPLYLNNLYSFSCPNPDCSKVIVFSPKVRGNRAHKCLSCSTVVIYEAVGSIHEDAQIEKSRENHRSMTDPAMKYTDIVPDECADAYIEWREFLKHKAPLDKDVTIIGRNDKRNPCDIMIDDGYMSSRSLEIKKERTKGGGILYLARVLRATNQVFIQEEPCKVGSSIYLSDGYIIKMGETTIKFRLKKNKSKKKNKK